MSLCIYSPTTRKSGVYQSAGYTAIDYLCMGLLTARKELEADSVASFLKGELL